MSKHILVVDDSATMLMSLKGSLETQGYKVTTAQDGNLGCQVLKSGVKPDLIITDVNMPNMNGLEFIKQVRGPLGMRFVPILVLTTESSEGRRTEAKQLGATGWLVKPVGGADLIKVVKQVVPGA